MDIVFIDPGYGKGLTTLLGSGTSCVESDEYNPVNGVAFTGNNCTVTFPFPTSFRPTSAVQSHETVSCRFSVYFDLKDSAQFSAGCGYPNAASNNGVTRTSYIDFTLQIRKVRAYSENEFNLSNVSSNGWHNVAFAIDLDSNGAGDCNATSYTDVDGFVRSGSTKVNIDTFSSHFSNLFYFSFRNMETSTCYISNIIVATSSSPSPLLLTSQTLLVRLPLSTPPTGDFLSVGDGEYVGNTSGQKLLQTINASDVITKYGATSKVSHLVTYGAPGYRVGSNIETAYGISEEDGTITQHGSCSLSADTNGSAVVAWETPSTTLNDVDGLKVGWQV